MESRGSTHSASSQVNPVSEFEEFLNRNLPFALILSRRLAARYGLPNEFADDIRIDGNMRIWKLFPADAKAPYKFLSENQDRSLLRQTYTWAAKDIVRRENKDRLFSDALYLDAQMGHDDEQNSQTLADTLCQSQPDVSSDELSEDLEKLLAKIKNPGWRLVIDHLLGKLDNDDLAAQGYNDNYIRVTKNRLKRWFEKHHR